MVELPKGPFAIFAHPDTIASIGARVSIGESSMLMPRLIAHQELQRGEHRKVAEDG